MEIMSQGVHVVQLIPAHNHNASGSYVSASTTYISVKGYHKALVIANMGAITGAVTFKFRQAKAVAGTSQKALSHDGFYTDAVAVASASVTNDTYVYSSSASSSTATGTTNNTMYVFPVDLKALDVANSFDCIGVAAAAANAYFGLTVLLYPRYGQQVPTVTLVD